MRAVQSTRGRIVYETAGEGALAIGLCDRPGINGEPAAAGVPVLLLSGDGDVRLPEIRRTAERVPQARLVELGYAGAGTCAICTWPAPGRPGWVTPVRAKPCRA
ncbi:hypothetical protein [Actinomadura violacea]|uniref:Uncharacterized protein n=1 Tax=Actinomadura violacea TaxID=2819934 RepID=A0ABS3S9K0_9ACTN|nr:hypothetical protein [Actinomadura violacea]MBO2465682.1 hypothetical protein [Actinomadura violacea]